MYVSKDVTALPAQCEDSFNDENIPFSNKEYFFRKENLTQRLKKRRAAVSPVVSKCTDFKSSHISAVEIK